MALLVDDVWKHPTAVLLLQAVDRMQGTASRADARSVFTRQGFTGSGLDIALGVSYAECGGYSDAVGDLALIDAKWGPSIGAFQIRALRNPLGFSVADRYRYAWALLDVDFNTRAAYIMSEGGTDWHLWSTFTSGSFEQYRGKNFTFRTGHVRAGDWNK